MTERSEAVMKLVERELKKNPDVETRELYEKAVKADPDIKDLTLRQFHARYPLQVKRKRASQGAKSKRRTRKARKPRKAANANRDAVRDALLELAKDVTKAEDQAGLVDLVSEIDGYVDKVMKAAGR